MLKTNKTILSLAISGEVGTKSPRTRKRFHQRLCANVRAMLERRGYECQVHDRWERIDVEGAPLEAVHMLADVFGVQSVRVAREVPWKTADDLIAAGRKMFAQAVAGRTFAVRARRLGPREHIALDSQALARDLGAALVRAGGRVRLDDPEIEVRIEVRAGNALIFERVLPGPAGLPLGVEGRALALISGGFDSPVAAWQLLRRGLKLDFVLFNLAGWPQEHAVRRVLAALDWRWMAGSRPRLYVVDFRPLIVDMRNKVDGRYWQVLLKRLMVRAAESIARRTRADALITGEALGQVSSQTLPNLAAIEHPIQMPIFRPLVGMNKSEIVACAQTIGTAEISAGVEEFCALDGGRPVTRVTIAELDREELKVGLGLLDALIERARVVPAKAFGLNEHASVEVAHVPEQAAVFDLRSEREYQQWAWPGAVHLEFSKALELAGNLPNDRIYLFYCEVGMKSAFLAERLREAGFEAYSFRGGIKPMKKVKIPNEIQT